ncbi:Adam protease adm-b [Fusarium albosuccineum]|uniref:Disintegrin and metalloproteinase domain-containing protein B n=1 Tax=Fusarium albosuccineum TaxID=1237068 RepID=A0A8H4LBF5_9HYPO|nr:Adam protease adm-b [Fusarium albosuccineum]
MLRNRDGRHFLDGAFNLDGDYHHMSLSSNLRNARLSEDGLLPKRDLPYMVVWRESDTAEYESSISQRSYSNASLCAAENPNRRRSFDLGGLLGHTRRQDPDGTLGGFDPVDVIGDTDGCPSSRRVALIGVATDCEYTAEFDSVEDARSNIVSQVNVASQVYEDAFNIALAVRNLTISDASCPSSSSTSTPWNAACASNVDISGRLSLFSEWRNRFQDDNAAWTLLSACESGSTVGMAWIGNICSLRSGSRGGSSVASTNVVIRTAAEWQVFAHELAHNFGASHDCTSSTCSGNNAASCCPLSASTCDADGQYLMNPQSGRSLESFSPCTIGTICTAMGRDMIDTSCLVDEDDVPDIEESQCGNGIVEPGETCDCGGEEGCAEDSCCNPTTCQLRSGAECDPDTDSCCTDQCQVAARGQVCRSSTGPCDPQETCDGESSRCPEDDQSSGGNGCPDDSSDNDGGGSGKSWFDRNRTVVIAVSSSVGGVLVALVAICLLTSCLRRRRRAAGNRLQKNNPFADPTPPGAPPRAPPVATEQQQVPTAPPMVHRYM